MTHSKIHLHSFLPQCLRQGFDGFGVGVFFMEFGLKNGTNLLYMFHIMIYFSLFSYRLPLTVGTIRCLVTAIQEISSTTIMGGGLDKIYNNIVSCIQFEISKPIYNNFYS